MNNVGQFRAVRDISIHHLEANPGDDIDGEGRGVVRRAIRRASIIFQSAPIAHRRPSQTVNIPMEDIKISVNPEEQENAEASPSDNSGGGGGGGIVRRVIRRASVILQSAPVSQRRPSQTFSAPTENFKVSINSEEQGNTETTPSSDSDGGGGGGEVMRVKQSAPVTQHRPSQTISPPMRDFEVSIDSKESEDFEEEPIVCTPV